MFLSLTYYKKSDTNHQVVHISILSILRKPFKKLEQQVCV